jgi:hypothetical protein
MWQRYLASVSDVSGAPVTVELAEPNPGGHVGSGLHAKPMLAGIPARETMAVASFIAEQPAAKLGNQ